MNGVVGIMSEEYKKLSHASMEDIYAAYFETKTIPTVWPQEGLISCIHLMRYLSPEDVV